MVGYDEKEPGDALYWSQRTIARFLDLLDVHDYAGRRGLAMIKRAHAAQGQYIELVVKTMEAISDGGNVGAWFFNAH